RFRVVFWNGVPHPQGFVLAFVRIEGDLRIVFRSLAPHAGHSGRPRRPHSVTTRRSAWTLLLLEQIDLCWLQWQAARDPASASTASPGVAATRPSRTSRRPHPRTAGSTRRATRCTWSTRSARRRHPRTPHSRTCGSLGFHRFHQVFKNLL